MYIPKNEMKNKTEKEASFDQECTQSINGIECHLELYYMHSRQMKVAVNLTQTLSQNLSNHWDGLCTLKLNSKIEKQASFEMIYPDVLTNNGSGGQNSLYKIDTENNQHIIVSPHSTDQKERISADISFRKIPEELDENEESSSSSHKEKTTSTSDQSSENVSESDNSLFTSSASSSVEDTPAFVEYLVSYLKHL
jgi:hypothetical protein